MIAFIVKRLISVLPIVFFITFLTLLLISLVPGSYFDGLRLNPQIGDDIIDQYEEKYHINENIFMQYWYWLRGVLVFDFGYSFSYHMPVEELIISRLGNTFLLSMCALLISWGCALSLGTIAAFYRNSWFDKLLRTVAYLFISIPGFILAIGLVVLAARWTNIPIGGMHSVDFHDMSLTGKIIDVVSHMIIPLVVLCVGQTSYLFRLMRSNVLDIMHQDYVRILRIRKIPKHTIIFKHVLRNSLNPLISIMGYQLPALVSGAALVEIITGWPGLGTMMLQAVRTQDVYVVMGNMFMVSFLLLFGNLLADIALCINDPQIRS